MPFFGASGRRPPGMKSPAPVEGRRHGEASGDFCVNSAGAAEPEACPDEWLSLTAIIMQRRSLTTEEISTRLGAF
jgi:hypothetical protein